MLHEFATIQASSRLYIKKGDRVAKVVILGAGLTGLATAYHLEQQNFFDFIICEKNERAGGLLRSFTDNGFTFDFTGHLLHINNDYFRNFLNTIAPLENFNLVERKAAIYSHNTLTEYPFQMNLFGLPKEVIYECITQFVERKQSLRSPKNFYEWVLKYFGAGMGKHFFFPYNSKILSYDIKKVLPSWTGRFVPQTSFEAVLEGAFEQKQHKVGYNSSFYYPKQGGIEFVIKQLVKSLKTPIITGAAAEQIDLNSNTIHFSNGTSEKYSQLVSTMPLDALLRMTQPQSHTTLASQADKLICNSVLNFNLGFNTTIDFDKHWIYYPEKQYPFYRLGFWHTIAPGSVPKDATALYGELSYLAHKTSHAQRTKLGEQAIESALNHLRINPNAIIAEKVLTLDHAYVIYDAWREQNLPKLLKGLQENHIHSTGRFGGWKYSSMQEAVFDGKETAELILSKLGATTYHAARVQQNEQSAPQHSQEKSQQAD